ncbi:MAG TPA: TetR/AcrR family transcriptional regulator [Terracidiphilus sp.]
MKRSTPYHHGNLHKALLDAAVALIGEVGPRAFTLREVARRAGVSHNAPYRHFASKDELLLAVAAEGFERLAAVMRETMEPGQSARERLELCGCGYVEFALRWPNHLLVMFDLPPAWREQDETRADTGLGTHDHDSLGTHVHAGLRIGEDAFQVLLDCIVAAQQAGDLPAGDPLPLAWTAWSLVHGVAKLATGGNLPLDRQGILAFTRSAARAILCGLSFAPGSAEDSSAAQISSPPGPLPAV